MSQSKPSRDIVMCSNTPYPVITRSRTPSYYEAATVCTKCTSTLNYCHCAEDVLPVPPPAERIIILSPVPADAPSTRRMVGYNVVGTVSSGTSDAASAIDICSSCKDNEEADAHQAEEVQPVRVEVAHGGDAQSQDPVGQDRGTGSWEDAEPLMTHNSAHPVSPIPLGFKLNVGPDFVPFNITDAHGHETPAKYVKVQMGPNPNVVGCLMAKGPCYRSEIHGQCCFDKDKKPHYTEEQMMLFNFVCAHMTDEALETVGDISLMAEAL